MNKEKRKKQPSSAGKSRLTFPDILLIILSVLIAANLAFGPIMVQLSGRRIKLFDNLLLVTIWFLVLLIRKMRKEGFRIVPGVTGFISSYKYEFGLAAVLIFSGIPRLLSIGYGLPQLAEQHEQLIVPQVIKMIRQGTLNHGIYDYGSLYFIFLYIVFVITAFVAGIAGGRIQSFSEMDPAQFFLAARAANVILSLVCIYLIYAIGKRLYDKKTALAAAAVSGAGTVFFLNSITARLEMLVLLFVLSAFYYMVKLAENGKTADYCLAGLFCGLAVGTKFYSVSIIIVLIYTHILARKQKAFSNKKLIAAFAIIAVAYLATNPFLLTDTDAFVHATSRLTKELSIKDHWSTGGNTPESVYARIIFYDGLGAVGSVVFLILFSLFLFKPDSKHGMLLLFPAVHFLLLVKSRYVFHRYILVIIPFLVLFIAGYLWKTILQYKKKIRIDVNLIFWAAVLIIAFLPAVKMIRIAAQYNLETTSQAADDWIGKNIPAGSRLLVGRYSVNPDGRLYFVTRTGGEARKYSRNLISLADAGFNYIITSSPAAGYGFPKGAQECLELIKKFEPSAGKISGPIISILKVKPAPIGALKKSGRFFLDGKSSSASVKIGMQAEDTLHLGSDWGAPVNDGIKPYRAPRAYPAAFFFMLSESKRYTKSISVSIDLTPEMLDDSFSPKAFETSFNGFKICSDGIEFNGKPVAIKCRITNDKLKFGKDINRLEFNIPDIYRPIGFEGKQILTIPSVKFHSVTVSSD